MHRPVIVRSATDDIFVLAMKAQSALKTVPNGNIEAHKMILDILKATSEAKVIEIISTYCDISR